MKRVRAASGKIVDRIKINALTREIRNGRACWIKRRRIASRPIMAVANRFFALAGNPVCALADVSVWQRWEIGCFRQLHGDLFDAFACGERAVGADELPGESLSRHLDAGTLTPKMLAAAGCELRRAHGWHCAEFDDLWSHGDPHSGNFVYDQPTDRARLIDFEVMHHRSLSADERHADDLLVLLQDLVGRIAPEGWLPGARAFLETYGRPEIVRLLDQRLELPRGLARLWWSVRTTYLSRAKLTQRINALRAALPSMIA